MDFTDYGYPEQGLTLGSAIGALAPWALGALGGGDAAKKVATAAKTKDPADIYAAGVATVDATRKAYGRAKNWTASMWPRRNATSVQRVAAGGSPGGHYPSRTAMVYRRRRPMGIARRRRAVRRRSLRRRRSAPAVRRPTYARRLTAGNGPYSLRVRRGGKAYPRLLGSGMNARAYKFSDSSMQIWGSNCDRQDLTQLANSIVELAPSYAAGAPYVEHCAMLFNIEGGGLRELHRRATDRIILKRLDLVITLNLGEAAQTGAGRLTLLWDREPNHSGARPHWLDVFQSAANYPTVPALNGQLDGYAKYVAVDPNLKTDLNSFLVPDQRNRFEIIYQQTVSLERGAPIHDRDRGVADPWFPGTFYHYAGGSKSEMVISKSLYLNRLVTYVENSQGASSGDWTQIVSGAIWVFWQSTNTRYRAAAAMPTTPSTIVDSEIRLDLKCRTFFVDLS